VATREAGEVKFLRIWHVSSYDSDETMSEEFDAADKATALSLTCEWLGAMHANAIAELRCHDVLVAPLSEVDRIDVEPFFHRAVEFARKRREAEAADKERAEYERLRAKYEKAGVV
jgi:hypothetical protein